MAQKHKYVFGGALSEMKHFLLGAALVLVLVTVVPALAEQGQEQGDRPANMPFPQPMMDGNFKPMNGDNFKPMNGGIMKDNFRPAGEQQGQPNDQFQKGEKMERTTDGTFFCFSLGAQATAAECDASDKASGKGPMKPMDPMMKPEQKMFQPETKKAPAPFTPATQKSPSATTAPKFDFSDLENAADTDVAAELFSGVFQALDGKKLKGTAAKAAAQRVAAAFSDNLEGMCDFIDNEDDVDTCYELFESKYEKKILRAKTSVDLVKVLKKYMAEYNELVGSNESEE